MTTIILKYDEQNPLIKSILNSVVLAGATIEEKIDSPYSKEFSAKIKKGEKDRAKGLGKKITIEDLWK